MFRHWNKTIKELKKPNGRLGVNFFQRLETLGTGNLMELVKLPKGEDMNSWIANNILDLFDNTCVLYENLQQDCTNDVCIKMTAGKTEYKWSENKGTPKSTTAPTYINNLFDWIDEQLQNLNIYPIDENTHFPTNFKKQIKAVMRRLFRVYAHIYYSHFNHLDKKGFCGFLNTSFKHFLFFSREFKLVEQKDLTPLAGLIAKIDKEQECRYPSRSNTDKDH